MIPCHLECLASRSEICRQHPDDKIVQYLAYPARRGNLTDLTALKNTFSNIKFAVKPTNISLQDRGRAVREQLIKNTTFQRKSRPSLAGGPRLLQWVPEQIHWLVVAQFFDPDPCTPEATTQSLKTQNQKQQYKKRTPLMTRSRHHRSRRALAGGDSRRGRAHGPGERSYARPLKIDFGARLGFRASRAFSGFGAQA